MILTARTLKISETPQTCRPQRFISFSASIHNTPYFLSRVDFSPSFIFLKQRIYSHNSVLSFWIGSIFPKIYGFSHPSLFSFSITVFSYRSFCIVLPKICIVSQCLHQTTHPFKKISILSRFTFCFYLNYLTKTQNQKLSFLVNLSPQVFLFSIPLTS